MFCKIFNIRLTKEFVSDDETLFNEFLQNIDIEKISTKFVDDEIPYWSVCILYAEKNDKNSSKKNTAKEKQDQDRKMTEFESNIYDNLSAWRKNEALKKDEPPFMIAHNKTLKQIACSNAKTKEDLKNISGLGERKIEKYGDEIIEIIKIFRK